MLRKVFTVLIALMIGAAGIFAQDNAQLRNVPSGQKLEVKGVVVSKIDDNTLIVRDSSGVDTKWSSVRVQALRVRRCLAATSMHLPR